MRNTFEIIFENVSEPSVDGLVNELLSHAKDIESIELSEEGTSENSDVFGREKLTKLLLAKEALTAMIRVRRFFVNAVVLDVALVRVVKYENTVDVDISFDIEEEKNPVSIMSSLHPYALELASSFSVGNVYGGLEPADDCATRYFTNLELGPLPHSDK
ncbi:hypothetical protein ACFOLJ_22480 [Rugamonas sp. CCM 8940]|uniref:hypothetical protein n=1 Tax=Rugamonas sp. CCM 8940 TaxID=2765359 RepID=UPI0018F75120|nr:hypothetical protein [Rugamonas sp. CCM 8940]MBJ7311491.1 hypothetical protein [Rugamonas sp. CCM 8940]